MTRPLFCLRQERLNDFDEKSLSVLASGLEPMKSSPNVDALKEGMRWALVFQRVSFKWFRVQLWSLWVLKCCQMVSTFQNSLSTRVVVL